MNEIILGCKNILSKYYGAQFRGLILYGSHARSEAQSQSDLDLLVLLNKPFNHSQELRRIVDLLYPIQLDSQWLISAYPADKDEFSRGAIQLYRNAMEDGIEI